MLSVIIVNSKIQKLNFYKYKKKYKVTVMYAIIGIGSSEILFEFALAISNKIRRTIVVSFKNLQAISKFIQDFITSNNKSMLLSYFHLIGMNWLVLSFSQR